MNYLTFTVFSFFLAHVWSQEIEFYPSQSLFHRYEVKKGIFSRSPRNNNNDSLFVSHKSHEKRFFYGKDDNHRTLYDYNKKSLSSLNKTVKKRTVDPIFRGHPKTREEKWHENFLSQNTYFDQTASLVRLLHNITVRYLNDCTPVILYDSQIKSKESYLVQNLLRDFPVSYVHGYINDNNELMQPRLLVPTKECFHYIVFLNDVSVSAAVLGKQPESKVVVVARSSQWAVQEFLAGPISRMFINLLVIAQSFKDEDENLESPYILCTHKLYTDGLGASKPVVLNSWAHEKYSRDVDLFPPKMREGYAGHRFIIAAADQPPFVIRRIKSDLDGGNPRVVWDGTEIRLLRLLAIKNNFSIEITEPKEMHLGPGDAVAKEIVMGRADMGAAGMYTTRDRIRDIDLTFAHSQDCAVFITLMSTALPRYRAILGPFHWSVWVALTFTYLFGIFPLAFSDKHTLRHLIHNSGEVENMFWYVFGTFTNCFTFMGKNSWSKSNKITTRLLIGWYWLFTIIITSCYTGSIIAFVTLPVFPDTVDTIQELLAGFYRVGTLDRGGWERWFFNSSDTDTNKLFKKMQFVPNVQAGIKNTTKAFFWPYAFLGSRAELDYIIKTNYTKTESKRAVLHISKECFVPFGVSLGFPNNSIYAAKLSGDITRMFQSGILTKLADEVRWEMLRSDTGKRISAGSGTLRVPSAEEKGLTLEDTQGMFLLLAAGFLMAATALISEWMGGFSRKCFFKKQKGISSNTSSEVLVASPISDSDSEIKILPDDNNSILHFRSRCSSVGSNDTLNGHIISLTEQNIMIHDNMKPNEWKPRRSSSTDLDEEVQDIFETDLRKRRKHSTGTVLPVKTPLPKVNFTHDTDSL